ncbi:hypothetical protein B0I35DRAFT_473203 [Stachybotrys elegans]|uniref:Midasin n=1 Tax=Stachybotrys elegans TaxID=80388 RepID=A0A8K0T5K4_9HYPO|nr:hypothetical protein B0I35DRAFT_473203 [Stachybotrys elegans]
MAMVDVARQRRSLLQDATVLEHLPAELLEIIQDNTTTRLLDAVSEAALNPALTDRIFVHFEHVFPDICARWVLNAGNEERRSQATTALARILPFAPYLASFLQSSASASASRRHHPSALQLAAPAIDETLPRGNGHDNDLLQSLVAAWRLLNFHRRSFGFLISPAFVQLLFKHESRAVRYVAVRIFCQLLRASDQKLEMLIDEHVGGNEVVVGMLDGKEIDYIFLSMYEHKRAKDIAALRTELQEMDHEADMKPIVQNLTPYVITYGQVILPRPLGPTGDPSSLVMTSTTTKNLENLAHALRNDEPILVHGSTGVGKTAMIHEVAKQFGMYSSMVTLHLNEQTDAKMLIGLYSTDVKPGSFQWRPGVLTTAVREGRWVLVEDLDRAPAEVVSTLLPLIERKELLIPSRGETIRAADTFRLFATVRTSRGMNGRENLPSLVGMRFWQSLYAQPSSQSELKEIILQMYPILHKFVPAIIDVFDRITQLSKSPALMSRGRSAIDRELNLRDLLKWCRRMQECLVSAGSVSGDEPISDTTRDWMFMEAVDCFVGSCPDKELGKQLVHGIAEEMHMSRATADHYVAGNVPSLQEDEHRFSIGRVQLRKKKQPLRVQKSKRPFASTVHAKRLLESIARAVHLNEPVLLVGETGIGKTTVVQQLADSLGHKLIAVNLSQQSEVGDLLGGFKPVNVRTLAVPLGEDFEDLFKATGISASKNQKYLEQVRKCLKKGQWARVSKLWKEAPKMFSKIVSELERMNSEQADARDGDSQPSKRRRKQSRLQTLLDLQPRWETFARNLEQFDVQISGGSGAFAFSFVEGNLIKAVRNGDWVLLDEINLASPDTLESIADLLTGPSERPSILLSETGEIEKIAAHPDFRIFGAMNPATDVGKRDLPVGIRTRFTEVYVHSPDADLKDLLVIIKTYLSNRSSKTDQAADDIARLYLNTKRLAEEKRLVDGANEVPHFSLRTLTRVLSYVNTISPLYGLRRALFEGFSMGFLTLLDRNSENLLVPLIYHHLLDNYGDPLALLSQTPKHPNDGRQHVKFVNKNQDRHYWLFQGDQTPVEREDYIITPYVERNLLNLVRATSTRRFPILIQGPTSAGKTSMIEYLANYTGNKFVRINNHEHTDLQEYLGTYVSGSDGKLRFQEGILVQAMRQGHWIVLDELNLAPTDVLEALNRLLDDNRELLIPETQEVVKPHENFILFATQNPPGLYGGRKVLSRAFRNRFLELHFDDIPESELEFILQQRSRNTSPPDCRRIVSVYKELSRLRQTSRLFEQKDSFATLRDLFRWALREADTREEIAAHGFMLLAERVRNDEERTAVKDVIEKVFKVKIHPEKLYSADEAPELKQLSRQPNSQGVVWTHAMRRLYVLLARALRNNEPVLLVGETGCGKTTVCQLLAEALGKGLHIVNAHQNTETGDLIGSQRPVRNRGAILEALDNDLKVALQGLNIDTSGSVEDRLARYKSLDASATESLPVKLRDNIKTLEVRSKALFEWSDGALVEAMRNGDFFLLDEISLADDSVLERLNSILEPQRTLLLAEKGVDNSFVVATQGFQFFATMNPGGDFGKKELSPALRNRFTEIWVPPLSDGEDIREIVQAKLADGAKQLVNVIIDFAVWFGSTFRSMATTPFSVREILGWVQFINKFESTDPVASLVHGASTVFVDSIGANPSAILATDPASINEWRLKCFQKLGELLGQDVSAIYLSQPQVTLTNEKLTIGDFSVPRAPGGSTESSFAFHAPTTCLNAMRVLRAMQMQKPILLEGSPGVGKTTLVAALAKACGQPLTRINLSDQTDLMDLFGTDVPVEGAEAGNFAWRDAPFLQAMQKGEWVLLDEMNLASQSVLEGLNACLDHRGEVYISELDQVFKRHPSFRLFAAQNPHHQGGGRKGLPASFVNRFIVVYADVFSYDDLKLIAAHNFPKLPTETIGQLIQFIARLEDSIVVEKRFGSQGGPWEFNLRDVLRWLNLMDTSDPLLQTAQVDDFLNMIVRQRFRTEKDRGEVDKLFAQVFGMHPRKHSLYHDLNSSYGQVGLALLSRNRNTQPEDLPYIDTVPRLAELESIMICVKQNIPCIISSPSGFGKTVLLEYVAALAGKPLVVFPMNADIDTMDLVGGFEQADPLREVNAALRDLRDELQESIMSLVPTDAPAEALRLLQLLDGYSLNAATIDILRPSMESLLHSVASDSRIGTILSKTLSLLHGPLVLNSPGFEWLDGVIVKALLTGQWLVLDNANMCNASVLDRLNSLLEPDGFLSINEHCGPGGEPRIIRPHPEFRIFLTMDPRYGELSRAMRNRAIEIHINAPPPQSDSCFSRLTNVEGRFQRYMQTIDFASRPNATLGGARVALDHLAIQDLSILPRYTNAHLSGSTNLEEYSGLVRGMLQYLQTPMGSSSITANMALYSQLPGGASAGLTNAQPIHPLGNPPVAHLLPDIDQAIWAATCYETKADLYSMSQSLEMYHREAQASKLASLNRLKRSLISGRVAAVSKDSTVKLADFLRSTYAALGSYVDIDFSSLVPWKDRGIFIRTILQYLQHTILYTTKDLFDEARFQAHLAHGTKLLYKYLAATADEKDQAFMRLLLDRFASDFSSGFKLSTGLSMEPLWSMFKPIPIPDKSVLDRSLELDRLGTRFDALRWRTNTSIKDLSKAMATLERAYRIVRDGLTTTDELVQSLTAEIESLEKSIGIQAVDLRPFLVHEFEALRQYSMLRQPAFSTIEPNHDLMVLSNTPTKAGMMLASSTGEATALQFIEGLARQGQHIWDGTFATSLWSHIQAVSSVSLNSLSLLEKEFPFMGHQITDLSAELASDPLVPLNNTLWQLLQLIFASHDAELKGFVVEAQKRAIANPDCIVEYGRGWLPSNATLFDDLVFKISPAHLQQVTRDHLLPAIVACSGARSGKGQATYLSALAWIHFSVGAIKLYVPDRVYDPQLRPRLEREFFQDLQTYLDDEIATLRLFEKHFTGRDSNDRIEILEQRLTDMGPLPEEMQPVFRPEVSELSQLQAEFANILKAVAGATLQPTLQLIDTDPQQARTELQFVYQDITRPTVNLLHCFLVGLSLSNAVSAASLKQSTDALLRFTPFWDGSTWDIRSQSLSPDSFEFLSLMRVNATIEGMDRVQPDVHDSIFQCFHRFYDEWNRKLEADRKEEEAKASLYRFRGSFEDEEEIDAQEFSELFPTYDEENENTQPTKSREAVRSTSLRVAEIHKQLFLEQQDPMTTIQDLCLAVGQRVASEMHQHSNIDRTLNSKMLASTMLFLNEKMEALTAVKTDRSYNFYTDANMTEAHSLVSLVDKIKTRFRQLQLVDEIGHMQPLADVLQSCDKLLELVHTEPLAKILPKVEQLHGHVYEWQHGGWASRVHLAPALYDALTETIIRWRRLELSTWANLFDMEQKKCEEDAYSWWFIAYQVVVAVPLSMVESPSELEFYVESLVSNLALYFSSSVVGQFKTRLALLRQLRNHLRLLTKSYPVLDPVYHAVANFITYYQRYEPAAEQAIKKGRMPIEKNMKDVLLVASWKDTNINALRESARKSHQKLFRIVRKFRGVLGQEMQPLLAQDLPDESIVSIGHTTESVDTDIPATLREQLEQSLPGWLEKHRRLANTTKIVSTMAKISGKPEMSVNIASSLDEFVSNLHTSMTELRTETPSTLTEENKEQVKHLKTRKRKLFADTLRDLRNMGFRHNLGQDKLASQASLSKILTSARLLENDSSIAQQAEYHFHKVLDLVPKARLAAREPSEDLSGSEVTRSMGFVEGILSLLLSQRSILVNAASQLSSLEKSVAQFKELGKVEKYGALVRPASTPNMTRHLPWLVQVLEFSIRLVQIHAKLGATEHSFVIEGLKSWLTRFQAHNDNLRALTPLPGSLASKAQLNFEGDVSIDLGSLSSFVQEALSRDTRLGFILQSVVPWLQPTVHQIEPEAESPSLERFANAISTLTDGVLVAVEDAKKAGSEIPRKDDEPSWFAKQNDAALSILRRLHLKSIENSLENSIAIMQKLDHGQQGLAVSSMAAVALATPIIEQFLVLCRQILNQALDIYRATGHLSHNLTKTFIQIASQGFCTPQEKSDETSGDSGKLESGTGLGDGEGAEDISKDIQPDEDLTELAQEANKEEKGDMEDEKDAVDMADEELEGEMGSVQGEDEDDNDSKKGDEEEEENDMDEEAGDVDDLDPTAVDEKMWDGDDEKAEKDQQGDKAKGKKDDEQMAAEENSMDDQPDQDQAQDDQEQKDEPEMEDEQAEEEEDVHAPEELNKQDQTVQENDTLALPEEMELDLDDNESMSSDSDDDLDMASNAEAEEENAEEEAKPEDQVEPTESAPEPPKEIDGGEEDAGESEAEMEDQANGDEVQEDPKEEEPEEQPKDEPEAPTNDEAPQHHDEAKADQDNAAPSDVKSSGQDQNADAMDLDEQFQSKAAEQADGEMGEGAADQDTSAGNKGATSRSNERIEKADAEQDNQEDSARSDPFKKLGDALEKWHRQQADIQNANPEDSRAENAPDDSAADQAKQEFQHLQDDEAAADTQAMGTADNEDVQPMDEEMAIDNEQQDGPSRTMEQDDKDEAADKETDKVDPGEQADGPDSKTEEPDDGRSGVKTRQGNYNREPSPFEQEVGKTEQDDEDEKVEETSTQLSSTHISDPERPLRDLGESTQQWAEFQSKTHGLALSLTSQLRLILTPSQSTKLSGSFRTGKRLNIKRIIPYIASSYKRDKIWMRRSIPTKRTYQILLCVDDSKSMGESSSGNLAMESLVMVSRSLTMLEAGQVGVVGFGSDVFTAHQLTDPFGSDAGAKVLQQFTFSQDSTDIARLIRQTIDTFRVARQQTSGNSDLWQLALIMSDGLTPSSAHDSIRRLLREAIEERIMIVFIIMDDTGKKKGDSVLELKEAKFINEGGESRVVIERYLDTFPFQYYLIVHNLEELPSALAGLLRTWFAEVTS